jgi:phosphatidylglycerol:prolipoprotein diacylglycerol transferase
MITFPDIKPYIVKIGPLQIRWYGLMYILGFISSYLLVNYQVRKRRLEIDRKVIDDIYFSLIIGLLVGARLGYIIFYNLAEYLRDPLEIIAVWHGGMSFHGGMIGSLIAGIYITRKKGIDFWLFSDLVIVTAPIGIGLGRLGNFINAELYGRITNVPWGMIFPGGGDIPRHPSQLYEAFFEGVVLFVILWLLKDRVKKDGQLTGLFLIFYGVIRFIVEFFRQPDPQLGFVFLFFTMGQVLSFLMILGGILLMFLLRKYLSA